MIYSHYCLIKQLRISAIRSGEEAEDNEGEEEEEENKEGEDDELLLVKRLKGLRLDMMVVMMGGDWL